MIGLLNYQVQYQQALKDLQSPHAIVLRDSVWGQIEAKDLVVGDVVEIKQGDRIPADLRMVELKTITLKTDQSILTVSQKLSLIMNLKKCAIMRLRKRVTKIEENEQICGISLVNSYKYLGVEINGKGDIQKHIQQLENKIKILIKMNLGNKILLWQIYMKPHFQYLFPIMKLQKKGVQSYFNLLWRRSIKQWLFLPKITPNQFLEALFGQIQMICQQLYDRNAEIAELRKNHQSIQREKKQKNKIRGLFNIPDNIKMLFLLPIRYCKTHDTLMTPDHINQVHGLNLMKDIYQR